MSPENALRMATIENELQIQSTYYVLFSSRFYNPFENSVKKVLEKIINLGHELGLHFDTQFSPNPLDEKSVVKSLVIQKELLADFFKIKIKSFTLHDPDVGDKLFLRKNKYETLKNASSPSYVKKFSYFSDSNGKWGMIFIK